MEHRKPYNIKKVIIAYNIFQVIYNGIIFGFAIYYLIIRRTYDKRCMLHLPLYHPDKQTERLLSYAYFINKIIDLLDTVFFVLRKSYKQITTLHVYHHVLMTYFMYWVFRYYGFGGQYDMMGLLNTFVHSIMYSYYLISVIYPEFRGNLWWKKYITKMQLLQFVLLLLQACHVLIFNPTCKFPLFLQYLQVVQSTTMILMFSNFYYHAYLKPKPQKLQKQQ
ncbi:elongation of very long chain fatty acids protein F-like isoform X2 [Drosophila innubila]|uniref:elongation of very long chain fatty acids protein F-like isoform X2 n=1 Tax=Drosophila innubila TaxID=198719 RepID=UPI00148D6D16|nr:elongation of very long chain fatty acids protein F-like isoform X2 [Drosophila innubila]